MSKQPLSSPEKVAVIGLVGLIIAALIGAMATLGVPLIQHMLSSTSVTPVTASIQTNQVSPDPTITIATAPSGLAQQLMQVAPTCTNPNGTVWATPLPQTSLNCSANGVLPQQSGFAYYAEADLDRVNNTTYSQTTFQAKVQFAFQNTGDTGTSAGLIIQTPQAQGVAGGYIFVINPLGNWVLQQVKTGSSILPGPSGTVNINSTQSNLLIISVQQGILKVVVNNTQVISGFSANPPSSSEDLAVGLIVEHPGGQSSAVLFSHFELDT